MSRRSRVALLLGFALGIGWMNGSAQTSPKPADTKPSEGNADYSKEAFVDEQDSTKIVFENDGTSTREMATRIRIQSDAGVQRFGVLTFSYQNATESIEVDYVRVLKPDGTMVATPADSVQDMPAEITRQAPFYSDLREKHVAVKGLSVGDVLEYHIRWHTTKPLAPGQFWTSFNLPQDFIVLRWELQINGPRDRQVKWKSPNLKPTISEEGGRRIFTWTSSQLEHKSSEDEKKNKEEQTYQAARGRLPPPDVQISTFQNWEEIGAWYNALQRERVKPSSEIRAKAIELTKNAGDDNAKLHAIYNYVATQFRYIGVAFGIGRYQPHSAAEVLGNQYGDCKDKHTLLASLLDAAGIKAYPALINTYHELDSDVPSPAQFDHVITAVPQGNGFVWLDATTEVAPFGYLVGVLRDKPALVIVPGKPSGLISTAADPPSKAKETFKIDARLKDDGTLEGKIERTSSGDDVEILLRSAFRSVPLPQWKDLVQQISYTSGFAGEVSEVTASPPEKTEDSFHFSYTYHRKDYPQWSERRISSPLPPMIAPAPDTRPSHPILLGALGEYQYESRVELPKGYSPQLPAKLDLKEDFGEYHASYSVKDGKLQTERSLVVKLREVPISEYDAYKKFAKAVSDDHEAYVELSSDGSLSNPLQRMVANLPASDNTEAMNAYADAMTEVRKGDTTKAIDSLNEAVKADPHFARAWMLLAQVYATTRNAEMVVETLNRANGEYPHQPVIYRSLVAALMGQHEYEEAVPVLQDVVKAEPSNTEALSTLGSALFNLKRYSDAADVLESATKSAPDRAGLYVQLGNAAMHAGDQVKTSAAFKKAIELDSSPLMFNDIGYELADANQDLPLALQYVEKAVREEEAASAKVTLSDLKVEDLGHTSSLAAFWDSLGWVYFRMGDMEKAEKYLAASWELAQYAVVADHLGQVYEKQRKAEAAVRLYQLALAINSRMDETRQRLKQVTLHGAGHTHRPYGGEELSSMRTFKVDRITPGTASAEFFLLFGPGSKLEDVKFISGMEVLRPGTKALSSTKFHVPLPDAGPSRLVRRGVLSCHPTSGCTFVLFTPDTVKSIY